MPIEIIKGYPCRLCCGTEIKAKKERVFYWVEINHLFNVMFCIYAHVPMSLRARTSELDEWPENKVEKKYWIWASHMLTGYSGWRATCWCGSVLSCSPFQRL